MGKARENTKTLESRRQSQNRFSNHDLYKNLSKQIFNVFQAEDMIDGAKRFCLGAGIGTVCYLPFEKIAQLINSQNSKRPLDYSLVDLDVKIQCLYLGILVAPITEEILYRGILQGSIFRKISKKCTTSSLAKIAQILAVSILFASQHHNKEYVFLLGLELGVIKESKLRLVGSIGAHMANNCLSLKPLFEKEIAHACES